MTCTRTFNIKEIGVDRWNATQLITDLEGDGFTMFPSAWLQGYDPGMKELYKLQLEGARSSHAAIPCSAGWPGNVGRRRSMLRRTSTQQEKRALEKIDRHRCLGFMGLDRAIRHEQQGSVI
jgi:hypothetical protein